MHAVDFHFGNMRVIVSVSRITEERLQIHSWMEQRAVNHTFTAGSGIALFDTLWIKLIKVSINTSTKGIIES